MRNRIVFKNRFFRLPFIVKILTALFLFFFLWDQGKVLALGNPKAVNGFLDLTGWNFALQTRDVLTACKIWVNDELVVSNGVVGRNEGEMVPQYMPRVSSFKVNKGTLQIVIQGSDFMYRGGFISSLKFGLSRDIQAAREGQVASELFLFGSVLFILAQAFILLMKFSRAFTTVEALSEELSSIDKLKDEFLANTSHELRTPLKGMIGIAESIMEGAAGTKSTFTLPAGTGEVQMEAAPPVLKGSAFEWKPDEPLTLIQTEEKKDEEVYKILIAEDESIHLQALVNLLSLENYTITTLVNSAEVLELLEKNCDYDLIILDAMMPKISGYEVCKTIRQKYSLFDLPVVMLIARNHPDNIIAGFEAGANDYIYKPFNKQELLSRVKNLIALKRAVEEASANARYLGIERQQRCISEVLCALNRKLTATLELEEVFERLFDSLAGVIPFDFAVAALLEDEQISPVVARGGRSKMGTEQLHSPCVGGLFKELLEIRSPILKSSLPAGIDPKSSDLELEQGSSMLGLPIFYQEKMLGAVVLLRQQADAYEENEKKLAEAFTNQAGIAIENAQLFEDLDRKAGAVQNLLNNTGQGFLTFNESLLIDEEYSRECKRIFGKNIGGVCFSELITLGDLKQKDLLSKLLEKILHENKEFKRELYLTLLPGELCIHGRNIKLDYKIIKDNPSEDKEKFMVILTDITEKRQLESQVEQERNTLKMVVNVVTNYNYFTRIVQGYREFCRVQIDGILNSPLTLEEKVYEVYRNIHTFKGNFSQIYMSKVADKLNDCETSLYNMRKKIDSLTAEGFERHLKGLDMAAWLEPELAILKDILGAQFFELEGVILVDKVTILALEEKMVELLPPHELSRLLPYIRRLRYVPFKDLIKPYIDSVPKLAERLEKRMNPVVLKGGDMLVDADRYKDFAKSLVHVFRNIVDHGIEYPGQRIRNGKDEKGTIVCRIENLNDHLSFTISDDGRGIDIRKIREASIYRGILDSSKVYELSEQEVVELVFHHEITSCDEVGEISGRGIGLASVKHEVCKIGGQVGVRTEPGKGTEFYFRLPSEDHLVEKALFPL